MKTDNLLTLPDGRKLAFAEFGKPDDFPVLYFHGTPSSRLEPLWLGDDRFSQYGLRVICPDRPGIGRSDFHSQREFSDWSKDMAFLTEALRLDRFSVLGVSGGSGYAAVCAAKIPEKIAKAVIVSGAWHIDSKAMSRIGFPMNMIWKVAKYVPFLLPPILKSLTKMMSQPPKNGFDQASNNVMPPADNAAMAQPGMIAKSRKIVKEMMKQGSKGPVWDIRLYVREWDFDPAEIQIPLTLFHGEQDRNVPLALVQRTVKRLPRTELITYPEDGHISTYINHFDEIAKALMPD